MKKGKLTIYKKAFSTVEIILSISLFGFLVLSLSSTLAYSIQSGATSSQEIKANFLLDETMEAIKNIKDSDFINLTNGVHGIEVIDNEWQLNGALSQIDEFSRSISISEVDQYTKQIIATINWNQEGGVQREINTTTIFTNWERIIMPFGNWNDVQIQSNLNLSGSENGLNIRTLGNYAFITRTGLTNNFVVLDITDPNSPLLVTTITIPSTPTDLFLEGQYAYVTTTNNSQELVLVGISDPTNPSIVGGVNIAGNSDANGVFATGNKAYVTRVSSGDRELYIFDVTNPLSIAQIGSFEGGNNYYEIFINGDYAYIASSNNAAELTILNISNSATPVLQGSLNITSNNDGDSLTYYPDRIVLSTIGGATNIINVSNPSSPSLIGFYNAGGNVGDIALNSSNQYLFLVNTILPEFIVLDISLESSPILFGSRAYPGGDLTGLVYMPLADRVLAVGTENSTELIVYRPN